jgi:hypothetical protein
VADNILTKDRDDADLDIAAKDSGGVKIPRNILVDTSDADIDPATSGKQDTANTSLASIDTKLPSLSGGKVPVTDPTALPLPSGAATAAKQDTGNSSLSSIDTKLSGAATEATLAANIGALTETAPVTDTASSGLNGRLQRIAQRITSLIAALGSPFQAGGSIGNTAFGATQSGTWTVQPGNTANTTAWKVDNSAVTQPVSAASLPLPSGAATEATLAANIGSLTETAPVTDTASSGLNGRLQRIAQRITSLIALLPASLGPKAGASSLSVVEATPTTVTIVSNQTSATGATWVALGSQACEQLDIVNTAPTAVDLEVRRGSGGNTIVVPAGGSRMFIGLANASDLQVRRFDQSSAQVTFTGEAIKA